MRWPPASMLRVYRGGQGWTRVVPACPSRLSPWKQHPSLSHAGLWSCAQSPSAPRAMATLQRTQLDVARDAWEAEVGATGGSSARAPMKQLESLFGWWEVHAHEDVHAHAHAHAHFHVLACVAGARLACVAHPRVLDRPLAPGLPRAPALAGYAVVTARSHEAAAAAPTPLWPHRGAHPRQARWAQPPVLAHA